MICDCQGAEHDGNCVFSKNKYLKLENERLKKLLIDAAIMLENNIGIPDGLVDNEGVRIILFDIGIAVRKR